MDINKRRSLAEIRRDYQSKPMKKKDLHGNPVMLLNEWLGQALESDLPEPNSMILSTVDRYGRPLSRTVLLKGIEKGNLVFYTNYNSDKARQLRSNPYVSALFLWLPLARQIRVNGKVVRIARSESEAYFKSRPRGSQIGAWASPQSEKIPDRQWLENKVREIEERFRDKDPLPLPENWGGYAIIPDVFEFWQGREDRLHDRFQYRLQEGEWSIDRLAP